MTEKGKFLKKINEAFAKNNTSFILKNVTDDIEWIIPGDEPVTGIEAFRKKLESMVTDHEHEMTIDQVITHGLSAAVNGTMKMKANGAATYAFCDVYVFRGFKNPKIRKMISYVVELKAG